MSWAIPLLCGRRGMELALRRRGSNGEEFGKARPSRKVRLTAEHWKLPWGEADLPADGHGGSSAAATAVCGLQALCYGGIVPAVMCATERFRRRD